MKRTVSVWFLLTFVCRFAVSAQENFQADTDLLEIQWKLIENKHEGENQILASFTIANKSRKTLEADGWKIYFSYPKRNLIVISGNVKMKNINGDFCSIEPDTGFRGLKPSQALEIIYKTNGKSYTYSDAPLGLYIVYNQHPEKGYTIKNYSINYIPEKEKETLKLPAQDIFNKNSIIKDIPSAQLQPVLPSPVNYQKQQGSFTLSAKTTLTFHNDFENEATLLNQDLQTVLGKSLNKAGTVTDNNIHIKKEPGYEKEEYKLDITTKGMTISASEPAGIFYGIQTLKLMIDPLAWRTKQKTIEITNVKIHDKPRFAYRSFMLDVARNFQTKEQIFRTLDLLALYKLNTLHFHLNDDEGWRLEIPDLPELAQIGSQRGHTSDDKKHLQPSYGSGPDAGVYPGSGYYTRQDFVEILKYARERHIKIIPEIETPGHARAAIKAMDARYERLKSEGKLEEAKYYLLRDTLDSSVYRSVQGYKDNVMNIALPSVYHFIEKVTDEIIAMYKEAGATLTTIHIGGDEVPAGVWTKSPAMEQLMKSEKIESHDDLWYYYLNRVNKILKSKELYLSGWEEVAMRKTKLDGKNRYIANPDFVNENFHAYVWNNVWGWGAEDLAYRLANAGYKVVLAPVTNFYFDLAYEKDADEPGLYWGSYLDVDKPFYLLPYDYYKTAKEDPEGKPIDKSIFNNKERLTEFGKTNIVGLQCQIWSEKIRGAEQQEYMMLPKILGFAERAWAKAPKWETETDSMKFAGYYEKDWNWFVNLLGKRELPRLDYYTGGYHYRIPPVGLILQKQGISANIQTPGLTIRYTTDETEPTEKSPVYKKGLTKKGLLKFKAFNTKGRGSRTTEIYVD